MDWIRIEEGESLDEGSCNRCTPKIVEGKYVHEGHKVKLVYFYGFVLRLCDEHYQEMLKSWAEVVAYEKV